MFQFATQINWISCFLFEFLDNAINRIIGTAIIISTATILSVLIFLLDI